MKRLAWFTPLPPERSGIATYSVEVLDSLTESYDVDIVVDSSPLQLKEESGRRISAHDFLWRHRKDPYDLIVYQLGNATCHDYIWPYMFRYPGLVVLHDGQLHQARARLLFQQKRYDDYRAEFEYNHPDAKCDIAYLGISGFLGSLNYFWPMLRTVVNSAKVLALHNMTLVQDLKEQFPTVCIERIRMGVSDNSVTRSKEDLRAKHNISKEAVVFAAFGRITPEKRISQAFRALAATSRLIPHVHLLLVGESAPYYDAVEEARRLGVADRVTFTGFVSNSDLDAYMSCVDVCLCMRWPSSGETSASWLRCLASGRATIVTDLHHTIDLPALVTRGTWTVSVGSDTSISQENISKLNTNTQSKTPLCVSIDIMDEEHSLQIAMYRLARDAKLRQELGKQARAFWTAHHTLKCMQTDYQRVIDLAINNSQLVKAPLAHLQSDGCDTTRQILKEMGTTVDILDEL